jgi:hypothetical protein
VFRLARGRSLVEAEVFLRGVSDSSPAATINNIISSLSWFERDPSIDDALAWDAALPVLPSHAVRITLPSTVLLSPAELTTVCIDLFIW